MLIQWCLKGISEKPKFNDAEARQILVDGMPSMWLMQNSGNPLTASLTSAQQQLSSMALDNHVNNYAAVSSNTPYISLSAGSVIPRLSGGVSVRPAWRTALDFATQGGRTTGFIFRCWTIMSPKPCANLFGLADEVRDLNIFRQFWVFHNEGEVAAKFLVPYRQIEWVQKFDKKLRRIWIERNPNFVDPDSICNLIEAVI